MKQQLSAVQKLVSKGCEAEAIGVKIKSLERKFDSLLEEAVPYIIRLDGVSFRTFTAGMEKPFDLRFTMSMIRTASDLLDKTTAATAFVQSDEITLLFPPEQSGSKTMYAGRIQKISSIAASFCSARFNFYMSKCNWEGDAAIGKKIGSACFDARAFSVPDPNTAADALFWRHKYDCRRNVVNMVGSHYLKHSTMQNLCLRSVLDLLKSRHNIDPFATFSPLIMYGAFLKRIQVEHMGFNPKLGQSVPTVRTRIQARTFDWCMSPEERAAMTMAKFWEPNHCPSLVPIDI